jgi:serine phosphatase RsbU (regulator of sigma subunit)
VFVLGIIFLIYQVNNKIKRYNGELLQKNKEILAQKAEIEAQRDDIQDKSNLINIQLQQLEIQNAQIEKQNQDMIASIKYAKTIQDSSLPDFESIAQKYFKNSFLFFHPREEVSGDFYWMSQQNNKLLLAVADCTGHGVPGSLLSILGISALNNISTTDKTLKVNEILLRLRERIIATLKNRQNSDTGNQSIDISLISYDKERKILEYSGAYNSLFVVKNKVLTEYKADKLPVGNSRHQHVYYTLHAIELHENDYLYLFTDGFQDQLSDETKRKFLKKKFRDLLEEISDYEIDEQRKLLELILQAWRRESSQVDDITIIGLQV